MKIRLLTLSIGLFMLGSAFAQSTSNLIVFAEEGEQFYLILNGVRQNDNPETNVRVEGLVQEYYKAKIIFADNTLGEVSKNVIVKNEGQPAEVTYRIKQNKKGVYQCKYYSAVPIAQAPAPAENVTVIQYTTTPKPPVSQSVTVTETSTTIVESGGPGGGHSESVNVGVNVGGVDFGMNVEINESGSHSSHSSTTVITETHTTETVVMESEPEPVYVMPGYSGPVGCNGGIPMADGEFRSAKSSISSKDFASSKMSMAKQVAGANCLTAQQVKEITALFDFESDRVEFAKYAYDHTYDLGNYYKVNDAFEFESSIDELDEYISR